MEDKLKRISNIYIFTGICAVEEGNNLPTVANIIGIKGTICCAASYTVLHGPNYCLSITDIVGHIDKRIISRR